MDREKYNRTADCYILFRSHLIKNTLQRTSVVYIFQKADRPLSAGDILEISKINLKVQNVSVTGKKAPLCLSLATIHRTIIVLREINFIRLSHIENDTAYFEI